MPEPSDAEVEAEAKTPDQPPTTLREFDPDDASTYPCAQRTDCGCTGTGLVGCPGRAWAEDGNLADETPPHDAASAPAGERLEPVDPGQLHPGDQVRFELREPLSRGVVTAVFPSGVMVDLGDGEPIHYETSDYTWQRVVKDPPLPEEPNRVAIVILSEHHATGKKTFVVSGDDDGEILWCDGTGTRWRPPAITRVVYVYPAAPEGQPQ